MKQRYGVNVVRNRPHIKPQKQLDLNGPEGEQVIKSETKLILLRHQKAFKRLEDM